MFSLHRGWVALPCAALVLLASLLVMPSRAAASEPLARDFERPVGAPIAARISAGTTSFRSAVIRAPRNFEIAGIARARVDYEMRARKLGGAWSEWVEADGGDPAYFASSRELQIRSHGRRASGRVHFVDVGRAERVLGRGVGPRGKLARGTRKLKRPAMITRAQWGANRKRGGCKPRRKAGMGRVKAMVVHHTDGANSYSRAQAAGIVLGICRFHRNGNGWDDIGYNALVDRFGRLYVGRAGNPRNPVIGAHAQGFNDQTWGLASMGNNISKPLGKAAMKSVARAFAWRLRVAGFPKPKQRATLTSRGGPLTQHPRGQKIHPYRITGHLVLDATGCPGRALYKQLPKLRSMTQERIRSGGGSGGSGGGGGGGVGT